MPLTVKMKSLDVKIKSLETIKPSSPTPPDVRVLHLSYFDLAFPHAYVSQVFFYSFNVPLADAEDFMAIDSLRSSLREVLTYFYPLAGRFAETDNGNIYVDCSDQGVELIEAEVKANYKDIDFQNNPNLAVETMLPAESNYKSYIGCAPMLLIQVNRFECGSVGLATAFHHNIADAESITHFMNSWSELARGQSISVLPWFDRSFLPSKPNPNPKPNSLQKGKPIKDKAAAAISTAKVHKIFIFSNESINALKKLATTGEELRTPTSVECISALLWRCITRARAIGAGNKATALLAVNFRKRINPPVKQGFVGNALFAAIIVQTVGDVINQLPGHLENCLHQFISGVNDKMILSSIEAMDQISPQVSTMSSEVSESSDVIVTSWWRFPLYEASDFGWGKPDWISVKTGAIDGVVFLMGTSAGSGIQAWVCLKEETMRKLECDSEFISYVSEHLK